MSCDCLSKYHGRASRDTLRVWSGWASTVIRGSRSEQDYGPRYEPDYGPRYAPGRRATSRVGLQGRATRRAAGPRHAPGRGPCRTQDQLQRHRAAGPLDQQTDDAEAAVALNVAAVALNVAAVVLNEQKRRRIRNHNPGGTKS